MPRRRFYALALIEGNLRIQRRVGWGICHPIATRGIRGKGCQFGRCWSNSWVEGTADTPTESSEIPLGEAYHAWARLEYPEIEYIGA